MARHKAQGGLTVKRHDKQLNYSSSVGVADENLNRWDQPMHGWTESAEVCFDANRSKKAPSLVGREESELHVYWQIGDIQAKLTPVAPSQLAGDHFFCPPAGVPTYCRGTSRRRDFGFGPGNRRAPRVKCSNVPYGTVHAVLYYCTRCTDGVL